MNKASIIILFRKRITLLLLIFAGWNAAFGFKVENSFKSSSGFSSLLDLQTHYSKLNSKGKDSPSFPRWGANNKPPLPPRRLTDQISEHDRRRLLLQSSAQDQFKLNQANFLNGKKIHNVINGNGRRWGLPPSSSSFPRQPSGIDSLIITRPVPSVQFWSKRDTKEQTVPHALAATQSARGEKYAMMDKTLEQLEPDSRCKNKIRLCAKIPLKNTDCILHCHLSTHALVNKPTKFLFRLFNVYASFPQMLCPTFGKIYGEIPEILEKKKYPNSLRGFLGGVGITGSAPVNVDFIKNSPSALINNMVKFGEGEDVELVRSILDAAETASKVELSERNLFPSDFGNPVCSLAPKEGWFLSMIDATAKHPTLTDIFLLGYWMLTRGLNIDMPYPTDGLFLSLVFSIKILAGVDCSIVAYAEQGKPFKCQHSSIDERLESVAALEKEVEDDDENKYSWVVCGAHQVEIPKWIQDREGLNARADDIIESNSTTPGISAEDDEDVFPNPEEMYLD